MVATLPVFGIPKTGKVVIKEEFSLDRLFKRYVILELALGVISVVVGLVLGGPTLPALGICCVALAAQWSAHGTRHGWAIAMGLISLLGLAVSGIASFFYTVSRSGYANDSSPLSVLLALAVFLLIQSFLTLPLEDRKDLEFLRQGISRMIIFSVVGFGGIILTYLLSYLFYSLAVKALDDGYFLQDFHYLEGIGALSMVLTAARSVFRNFLGKEQLTHGSQEDINDQTA